MTRSFADFGYVMCARLTEVGERDERSTNKSVKRAVHSDGRDLEYWREGRNTKQHWHTARTVGYLAGYVDFLRSDEIPGEGIETSDGYVWLDKGVMCALYEGGCVGFEGGLFKLTPKGQALIAPFISPSVYGAAT